MAYSRYEWSVRHQQVLDRGLVTHPTSLMYVFNYDCLTRTRWIMRSALSVSLCVAPSSFPSLVKRCAGRVEWAEEASVGSGTPWIGSSESMHD